MTYFVCVCLFFLQLRGLLSLPCKACLPLRHTHRCCCVSLGEMWTRQLHRQVIPPQSKKIHNLCSHITHTRTKPAEVQPLQLEDLVPRGGEASAWRSSLQAEQLEDVRISSMSGNSPACSCWAMHDSRPLMVFANTDPVGEKNPGAGLGGVVVDQSSLKRLWEFSMPFSASCCDFDGSTMLFGDLAGDCYMARPDFSASMFNPSWQQYSLPQESLLRGVGGSSFEIRKSVSAVVCCPGDAAFYATENMNFHQWDYQRPREPVHSAQVWPLGRRTNCAAVDPESGRISLVGSSDGWIQMLDNRVVSKFRIHASIWTSPNAHAGGGVRTVKWHPQISTLFSSGGDDGRICLWDSRQATKPLVCIPSAHGIGVLDAEWSTYHPELLVSVGVDSAVSIWNFAKSGGERLVARISPLTNMRPLGVGVHANTVIVGDSFGGFVEAAMGPSFLRRMIPRHPALVAATPNQQIADHLYLRDLVPAFAAVSERIDQLASAGSYEQAWALIQLCYPREIVPGKEAPTEAQLQDTFESLASHLPARIPIPDEAAASFRNIKQLKLLLELHQLLVRGAWREALNMTDKLCKYYEKLQSGGGTTAAIIQPGVLKDVVQMVASNHYLSGVTMGCKLLRAMSEEEYAKNSPLTRFLLSPTVFDGFAGAVSQVPSGLHYVLTNQKVGLSQVDFVRDFTSRLWGDNPMQRVDKMMRKTEQSMISICQTPNRIYLASLAQTAQWQKFLLVYATLSTSCAGCDFANSVLPALFESFALALMDDWVSAVLSEQFDLAKAKLVSSLAALVLGSFPDLMPPGCLRKASAWLARLASVVPRAEASTLHAHMVQEISNVAAVDDSLKSFLSAMQSRA